MFFLICMFLKFYGVVWTIIKEPVSYDRSRCSDVCTLSSVYHTNIQFIILHTFHFFTNIFMQKDNIKIIFSVHDFREYIILLYRNIIIIFIYNIFILFQIAIIFRLLRGNIVSNNKSKTSSKFCI